MFVLLSTAFLSILLGVSPLLATLQGDVGKSWSHWTETIDHVVDTQAGETLTIDTDQGDIEVETWDKDQVRIIIKKTADVPTEEAARRLFADYPVDLTTVVGGIMVAAKSEIRGENELRVSTRVIVPARYSIDVETGGGGIRVGDLQGHVTARTGGGGINVGDVTGDLVVHTSGGGIGIGKVGGELIAHTAGGGIDIHATQGPVNVETAGGGVTISDAGGAVVAKTGGGGISIRDAGGRVVAETGGGGIDVDGVAGPVELSTGGGGVTAENIHGYIEVSTGGGGIKAELAIDTPGVDTHCDISTEHGDITLVIPRNLQATVDAEIRLERPEEDYRIESAFDLKLEGDPDGSDRLTATGHINGGGDRIRLRTTNSNIRIKRR